LFDLASSSLKVRNYIVNQYITGFFYY
jgi:hypothetical protein